MPTTNSESREDLAIAATGDSFLVSESSLSDAHVEGLTEVLGRATVAMTNLEMNLLPAPPGGQHVRWPAGNRDSATYLTHLGFNVVSLANNHASDHGVEGMRATVSMLRDAGLRSVGWGEHLADARAPIYATSSRGALAVIGVAVSSTPESRATSERAQIKGRPGVSPLRYRAEVTVDQETFETLKGSIAGTFDNSQRPDQLTVGSATIKHGEKTSVDVIADRQDIDEILAQIRDARSRAQVVVITIHSHEPNNRSQFPAAFLQEFAHSAVDAGAALIIGHGPHRLRGVEVYKGSAIFYSLGNFIFRGLTSLPASADDFEAGRELYQRVLGAEEGPSAAWAQDDSWWESVLVYAKFNQNGTAHSITLHPIDLQAGSSDRGLPRLAPRDRGIEILHRLERLSAEFSTRIAITDAGLGELVLGEGTAQQEFRVSQHQRGSR